MFVRQLAWLCSGLALAPALFAGCAFINSSEPEDPLFSAPPRVSEAERLRRAGEGARAIEEYEIHMQERSKNASRPPGENPAFYYLYIGDTYLEMNCPLQAQSAYERAHKEGVERELVVDRFHRLALWFSNYQQHEQAIALLKSVRDLDELLIDAAIDAAHKRSVASEDSANSTPPPPPCHTSPPTSPLKK
jgi:tetratricopeptide (TPR) repeat protein